jgi:hypothetical protein
MSAAGTLLYRLDYGTFLDAPPHYGPYTTIKVHDYGDGLIEAGWSRVEERKHRSSKGRKRETKKREEMSEVDIERSLRRAKANVRRKVMASGADHLLTLTYRENLTDEVQAWHDWSKFIRIIRKELGEFKHIVVAEKQKRGAIHFHAAVVGYQDVRLIRKVWLSIVGEGNIDVQHRGGKKGVQWKRNKLAGYLSKYISKAFDLESFTGRHRYRCSQNIEIIKRVFYLPYASGMEASLIRELIIKVSGVEPAFWWEPPGIREHYGWACTWS